MQTTWVDSTVFGKRDYIKIKNMVLPAEFLPAI